MAHSDFGRGCHGDFRGSDGGWFKIDFGKVGREEPSTGRGSLCELKRTHESNRLLVYPGILQPLHGGRLFSACMH